MLRRRPDRQLTTEERIKGVGCLVGIVAAIAIVAAIVELSSSESQPVSRHAPVAEPVSRSTTDDSTERPEALDSDVDQRLAQMQVSYSACELFFDAFRFGLEELHTSMTAGVAPAPDDIHLVIYTGRAAGACFTSHYEDFAPWLTNEHRAIVARTSQSVWATLQDATEVAGEVGAELVVGSDELEDDMLELGFITERK